MSFRAAIIGCGAMGYGFMESSPKAGAYSHAEAYMRCARTQVVGVCDPDAFRREACARAVSAPGFEDVGELLERCQPDLVSICSTTAQHTAQLEAVLAYPSVRGVLMEKPLAESLEDAERLCSLVEQRGIAVSVNYSRRHDTEHRRLIEALHAGEWGDIQLVRALYTKGLAHNGSHWFDVIHWLLGRPEAISARGCCEGDDPALDVSLRYSGGVRASMQALEASHYAMIELDVLATRGRVMFTLGGRETREYTVQPSPFWDGYRELSCVREGGDFRDMTLHALEDLLDSIEQERPPACTVEDACEVLRWVQLARESAHREGCWMELK